MTKGRAVPECRRGEAIPGARDTPALPHAEPAVSSRTESGREEVAKYLGTIH